MDLEFAGELTAVETIAVGRRIRALSWPLRLAMVTLSGVGAFLERRRRVAQ